MSADLPTPRPGILEITPYVGGEHKAPGASRLIRLASNEGALGPSPKARAAYRALEGELHRYPDGSSADLRAALGKRWSLDPERIVCGCGSDELLQSLVRCYAGPGDEVISSQHGFSIYPIAAHAVGATPIEVPAKELGADLDAMLAAVTPRTRLIFLANPNNPTGTMVTADELAAFAARLPSGVLLVIDAAYAEYASDRDDYTAGFELVDRHPNVVVTRTFSKIYAMAALRLGWCYAAPAIADVLNRVRGPFNLTTAASAAGIAAVEDLEFLEASRAHNTEWRAWTENHLGQLGLKVFPSAGNFLLVDFTRHGAEKVRLALKAQGILIRQMHSYGLPDYLRISIGPADEMKALLDALQEILRK
jgi:histidinol-phosphate aminotransferase